MTDPRIEQSLAEILAKGSHADDMVLPGSDRKCAVHCVTCEGTAWHARAMKLANEMEHYGHVTHYPAMCAKCRLLALLGDLS